MISAPIIITPPTGDVVDLQAVKLFLRADGSALDDEIRTYMRAVVADIERMTATRLARQVVELRADSFDDLSHLSVGPVVSIVSIVYQDVEGASQTLADDNYELFGAALANGIRPKFGKAWPIARAVSGAVRVQLDIGYDADTLPANLDLALKMAVRSKFDGTPYDLFAATINDRIWL